MPATNQFSEVQSGDIVRVTKADGTQLDATFRQFVGDASTIIVTTPPGVNEDTDPTPAQFDTFYLNDYQEILFPVPVTAVLLEPDSIIGEDVTVHFSNVGNSDITGEVLARGADGLLLLDVGGTEVVVRDYWYFEVL